MGSQDGAANTEQNEWTSEKLTWNLDIIGSNVPYVEFKMFVNLAEGASTNGATNQRGVGFDDFTIVIPEPATTSLLLIAFAGIAFVRRMYHRG